MTLKDPEEFNPLRALAVLWQRRALIAVCAFVGMALAALYAFSAKPTYRAEVLLAPNEDLTSGIGLAQIAGQFGGLASLAGLNVESGKTDKDVAIALLTGREFLEHFIVDNDLMPVLFSSRWDAGLKQWRPSWFRHEPSIDDAIKFMREEVVAVNEDRRTRLVRVTVDWIDRNVAASWANQLVANVNAATRAAAIQDAKKSQEYLRGELAKADVVELKQAINRMMEVQLKNEMAANVRLEYTFRVIDPARAPSANSFVKPRRGVLLGLGLFVGVSLGVVLALVMGVAAARRTEQLDPVN